MKTNLFESGFEELSRDDGEPLRVVQTGQQLVVLVKDRMEDVEKELERVLIEEVDLMHRLDHEIDRGARVGERHVLLRHRLDLRYHRVSLFHLQIRNCYLDNEIRHFTAQCRLRHFQSSFCMPAYNN